MDLFAVKKRIMVIAAYIPPNYNVAKGKDCLAHISNIVLDMKRKCYGSYIVVAGDFNQWNIVETMEDYPEMQELETAPNP